MAETSLRGLPSTYVENWSFKSVIQKLQYTRLGSTDMLVSELSLGGAHVSRNLVFNSDGTKLVSGYEDVVESIQKVIKSGINLIDTSPFYGLGKAELVLGKALEGVPRSSYYLCTKIGRKSDCTFDYSAEWVQKSVDSSLKKLGVQYLDVIHVHDVEYCESIDKLLTETLPALEKLKQSNKARFIGITGYPLHTLKEIIERSKVKIDVVLSYCRYTPFDQTLKDYLPFFKSKKLGIINAAILGMGLLTKNGTAQWHAAKQETKDVCAQAFRYCEDRGVNLSKLSVYYALQVKGIDTHLIGMEDETALQANLDVMINGVTEREKQVFNEVMVEIFDKLKVRDWEGVEVANYRRNPKQFQEFLLKF